MLIVYLLVKLNTSVWIAPCRPSKNQNQRETPNKLRVELFHCKPRTAPREAEKQTLAPTPSHRDAPMAKSLRNQRGTSTSLPFASLQCGTRPNGSSRWPVAGPQTGSATGGGPGGCSPHVTEMLATGWGGVGLRGPAFSSPSGSFCLRPVAPDS